LRIAVGSIRNRELRRKHFGGLLNFLLPSFVHDGYNYLVPFMRKILLMLALIASFAMHVPMPCPLAQAASHCPMHSTTAPCCRVAGCFSSLSARHDVASLEAPAPMPIAPLAISWLYHRYLHDFIRATAPNPSPPQFVARSIEFPPLLI
jgi:hypothetical protein